MRCFSRLALALVLLAASGAFAQPVPTDRLVVGRLPCAGGEDPRAHGVRQLLWELMKRTSVEAELEAVAVEPGSQELFRTPLLLWSCQGPVAALDGPAQANLRRFLTLGGFLLIDDPNAEPGGAFDRSAREALQGLFPDRPLRQVPRDHVVYSTFFLLDGAVGRAAVSDDLEAIVLGNRLVVVISQNDLLGAVSRDLYGSWEQVCEPGGEEQRERALRLGINLIDYALCLDYKNDRVHMPFLLQRRRL